MPRNTSNPFEHPFDRQNRVRPGRDPAETARQASKTAARRATRAARQARTSPAASTAKQHRRQFLISLIILALDLYVTRWLAANDAPGWLVWTFGGFAVFSMVVSALVYPVGRKIRIRNEALAREQVYRARKLAGDDDGPDMAAIGVGNLFDAWPASMPPLHRSSVEAGVRFALDRMLAEFDDVDRDHPKPTVFGKEIPDDQEGASR